MNDSHIARLARHRLAMARREAMANELWLQIRDTWVEEWWEKNPFCFLEESTWDEDRAFDRHLDRLVEAREAMSLRFVEMVEAQLGFYWKKGRETHL